MRTRRLAWLWTLSLFALLGSTGCLGRSRAAELYPEVAEHQNKQIESVRFVGGEPFRSDTLQAMIDSEGTHCNLLGLPLCVPFIGFGKHLHRLNVETVRRDVARLAGFYRREGYFGTRVLPRAEPDDGSERDVVLSFVIQRGDPVLLDSLTIDGVAGIFDPDSLANELPLKRGDLFDLGEFELSADQVLRSLQSQGYAYAEILRNYSVDTLSDRAVASVTAIPGVQARVDSIIVVGAEHLGRRSVMQQLRLRPGDPLRLSALVQSQSNLYNLEVVQLASVAVAPDSQQITASDSSSVTVLVTIVEAPVNQAETAIGFGSVECFRTDGSWTNRSFGGGARRMHIAAAVSKLGLGGFANAGLGKNLCSAFRADTFEHKLDYRVGAEFTQPYFLSPSNLLSGNLHAERVSEPNVYQREARGGGVSIGHRLARRTFLTGSVDLERVTTLASPVLFCTEFQVCAPEDLDRINEPRNRNTISVSVLRDRTDNPIDAVRGYVVRSAFAWAAPWLSSTVTFTRWTGEGTYYRTLGQGWVFAGSVRLGNFFQSATLNPLRAREDFLPPEERFYAGGATTVRGFSRNGLGPGVYITRLEAVGDSFRASADTSFVPLGGTSLGVVNAEVRFPSPIMSRQMRLAAFLDGGTIANGNIWNVGAQSWRFTPGVGFRIATPVGPARVDVAYNPYNPPAGVLFQVQGDSIAPVLTDYTPPVPGFFGRMRLHVAIGQAF